jgi:hypothetical protein
MADETNNEQDEQQQEESSQSLWEMFQASQGEEDEQQGDDEQEEQDEEIAKQDKLERKLSGKMDNLQKKFEQTMLRERISKFEGEADELTLEMFKSVASDVKSLEDFDKAVAVVNSQAKKLEETAAKYRAQYEQQAAAETARAWGTGPLGGPVPKDRDKDYEEKLMERVAKGDTKAIAEALIGDDLPNMYGR